MVSFEQHPISHTHASKLEREKKRGKTQIFFPAAPRFAGLCQCRVRASEVVKRQCPMLPKFERKEEGRMRKKKKKEKKKGKRPPAMLGEMPNSRSRKVKKVEKPLEKRASQKTPNQVCTRRSACTGDPHGPRRTLLAPA